MNGYQDFPINALFVMFIMTSAIYSLLCPLLGYCIIICFASHFESHFNSLCIVMNLLNLHVFLVLRNGVAILKFSDLNMTYYCEQPRIPL